MKEFKCIIYDKKEERLIFFREIQNIDFVKKEVTICIDVAEELKTVEILKFSDIYFLEYTGLKDSKGEEIYNGDILKYEDKGIGYDFTCLVCFGDVFCPKGCCFELLDSKGVSYGTIKKYLEYLNQKERVEVIGNIFEDNSGFENIDIKKYFEHEEGKND